MLTVQLSSDLQKLHSYEPVVFKNHHSSLEVQTIAKNDLLPQHWETEILQQ